MTFRRFKQILKRMYWLPCIDTISPDIFFRVRFEWFSIMGAVGFIFEEPNKPYSNICQLALSIRVYKLHFYISLPIVKKFTYYPGD